MMKHALLAAAVVAVLVGVVALFGGRTAERVVVVTDDPSAYASSSAPAGTDASLAGRGDAGVSQPHATDPSTLPPPAAGPALDETVSADATVLSDMKAELAQIAQAYEAASKYPAFSQPVFSGEALQQFMPESPSAVSLPFPREDGRPGVRVSLSLNRYQYFPGDPLYWKLDVQDPEGRKSWQASLSVRALTGAVLIPDQVVAEVVQGTLALPEPLPGVSEYQLQVRIESEGERYFVSAPFRLNPAVARINGLSWAAQDGSWLNMALSTDVFRPGYYFLSANLYNAQTGEPVVHLEGEQRLGAGSATLTLKAHASALRARGDAGPYVLKDLRLIRGAEEGEREDLAGQPPGAPIPVPGFALDTYDDTPWEDPEAAERTEFLKKLAGFSQEP